MTYHLGVDLGTTFTAAAVARDGRADAVTLGTRSTVVPSVVHLDGERVLVGESAARRAALEPEQVAREFKRRVGDPTPLLVGGAPVAAEALMARVLDWVVAQVSATEGGRPASVALAHPANWGEYKLDLLAQAVRHRGLTVDHWVPEPVAAATTYALQRPLAPGTVVAVYDLGGGTFDAAVVRAVERGFEIIGRPDGLERLGGIDFDHAVFRHVLTALDLDPDRLDPADPNLGPALAQLREECVEAKEALSVETDVSVPVMLPNRHTQVRLTRTELEAMIRPSLAETVVALRRTIVSAAVPVDEVTAVLLVGGSSRIPLVAQLVTAELGVPTAVDARPKEAIPVGAAFTALRAAAPDAAPPPAPAPTPAAAVVGDGPPTAPTEPVPAATGHRLPPPPTGPPPPTSGPYPPPAPAVPSGQHPFPPAGTSSGAPAAAGGGRRKGLAVLAAVAVVAAGVAGVLLATSGGDGDGDVDSASPTTTTATSAPAVTTTAAAGSGGLGELGDLLDTDPSSDSTDSSGSSGDAIGSAGVLPPLPGDDWNPEARTVFVDACAADPATALLGGDPAALCGCLYDEISTAVPFADFNAQWVAEDIDTSSPSAAAINAATVTCAAGGAGG